MHVIRFVIVIIIGFGWSRQRHYGSSADNSAISTSSTKYEKRRYNVGLAKAICAQTNLFAKSKEQSQVQSALKDPLHFPQLTHPSQSCHPTKHNISFDTENEIQKKVKFPKSVWIWEEKEEDENDKNECTVLSFYKTSSLLRTSRGNDQIRFYLYTLPERASRKELKIGDDDLFSASGYVSNARLVIVVHGWGENIQDSKTQCIKFMNAYFDQNHNINIVCVDWLPLAGSQTNPLSYPSAATNTLPVGQESARLVEYIFRKGVVTLDQVHAIGFSFGAHVVGVIGDSIKKSLNDKIGRVTGLDPARVLFDHTVFFYRRRALNKEDAKFVDVIHTSSCSFGSRVLAGHADFFPNGGRFQGGHCALLPCVLNVCSHMRCPELYEESILNPSAFKSCKCSRYTERDGPSKCSCTDGEANMGEHVNQG